MELARYGIYKVLVLFACISFLLAAPMEIPLNLSEVYNYHSAKNLSDFVLELDAENEISMKFIPQKLFTVPTCIGSTNQCFNVILDTGSFIYWVGSASCSTCAKKQRKFNASLSETLLRTPETKELHYGTGEAAGDIVSDQFNFGTKLAVNSFYFLLVKKAKFHVEGADGILGVGYGYNLTNQIEYSILSSLKQSKQIAKNIFSIKYHNNNTGTFYIGELPSEISNDLKNYTTCKLELSPFSMRPDLWSCQLDKITINHPSSKVTLNVDEDIIFDSGSNFIFAPFDFGENLAKSYFATLNDGKQCFMKYSFQEIVFFCKKSANIKALPVLNLLIGGVAYRLSPENLFIDVGAYYQFLVIMLKSQNYWLVGQVFLKNFHVIYDYESKLVGFYGGPKVNATVIPIDPDNNTGEHWYIIFIILIFLAIGFGLYLYYKKKQQEKMNYEGLNQGINSQP